MPYRMIKDTIRTSRNVNGLTDFQFRVWVHLITYVDDFGRGSADAELLKGLLFPRRHGITVKQINDAIGALANKGMVILYDIDGEPYLYFPKWGEHQRIRTKVSKFPEPQTDCGVMPQIAADCRRLPPETKPNQTKPETRNQTECIAHTRDDEPEEDNDPDGFEEFWTAYPRKTGDTRTAYFEYLGALQNGVTPDALLEAATALAERTKPEDFNFLPAAEKWLRNKGWLEQAARKKVNENGKRDGSAEKCAEKQFNVHYDA